MLEDLRFNLMLDEFLVLCALNLTASLTQLAVVVDLVGQVHSQEVLLLLRGIQVLLDLVERFFGAKVRLVVEGLDDLVGLLDAFLLVNLVANEVNVGHVHLNTVRASEGLLAVHVIHHGIELLLLGLTMLLNLDITIIEASQSLLVDVADRLVSAAALMCSVVVHGEWALGAEELGDARVILV